MKQTYPTAQAYHTLTEYSRRSLEGHRLDWSAQPSVYKAYPKMPTVAMQPRTSYPSSALGELHQRRGAGMESELDMARLTDALVLTNTLTAQVRYPGQELHYRSAASAGALYPNEIYVVTTCLPELPVGVYHYDIRGQALNRLRRKNCVPHLEAAVVRPQTDPIACGFLISGIFSRSSWKYRKRAYRYVLLDAGHIIENLFLSLNYLGLPFEPYLTFDDTALNRMCGLDSEREAVLACLGIRSSKKSTGDRITGSLSPLPDSIPAAGRVSRHAADYPEILAIHAAGKELLDAGGKRPAMENRLGISASIRQSVRPAPLNKSDLQYPEILQARRSRRNFVPQRMSAADFSYLVRQVCGSFQSPLAETRPPLAIGMLVNNVAGLEPGFYLLDPFKQETGLVETGQMGPLMSHICLNQEWLRHAAVHFVFLTNLRELDHQWGARGYREAMITAGRVGQMIYLAATARTIGACGIGAFFDDEARDLLGLGPDCAMLYLVAAGPVKRF